MSRISSWLAPLVLGAAAVGASLVPAPAQAQSAGDLIRILVDAGDVSFRAGTPYYRHGSFGYNDRLVVVRDRYGRPVYYRNGYRNGPTYGAAYGHHRNRAYASQQRTRCDSRGRCVTQYYDPRQDHRGYGNGYGHDGYYGGGYRGGYDGRGRW